MVERTIHNKAREKQYRETEGDDDETRCLARKDDDLMTRGRLYQKTQKAPL